MRIVAVVKVMVTNSHMSKANRYKHASTQSSTPPMKFLIPGCVDESLHINLELQIDLAI